MKRQTTALVRAVYFHWALCALINDIEKCGRTDKRAKALRRVMDGVKAVRQLQAN